MKKIQIHWSFVAMAVWMLLAGWAKVFGMFVLFVTLHEAAHMIAVLIFGGKISSLRLTAIGEAAEVSGLEKMTVPQRYMVYMAGPAFNLFLAFIFFIFGWKNALHFNLLIGTVNLIPIFPLDGGRLAQQFLGSRVGTLRGNRIIARFGRLIGLAAMLAGVIYAILYPTNILLLCVGKYLHQWNKRAVYQLTLDFFLHLTRKAEIHKGLVPIRFYAAYPGTPLRQIVERLDGDHITHILIDNRPELLLTEAALVEYVLEHGLNGGSEPRQVP